MVLWKAFDVYIIDGDGDHGQLPVVFRHFVVERSFIADDDIACFYLEFLVVNDIIAGSCTDSTEAPGGHCGCAVHVRTGWRRG